MIFHHFHRLAQSMFSKHNFTGPLKNVLFMNYCITTRAGNLLIGFLSESLVFCEKMNDWAILSKNERLLIRSFLVSNLSDSLMVAHFLWATWVNRSWLLIFGERPEWFAHIALFWWATWEIPSHRSEEMSDSEWITQITHQKRVNEQKWAIRSFFNTFFFNRI